MSKKRSGDLTDLKSNKGLLLTGIILVFVIAFGLFYVFSDYESSIINISSMNTALICGDNICDSGTESINCPQDCPIPIPNKKDYIGVYRPSENRFYLRKENSDGTTEDVKIVINSQKIQPGMDDVYPIAGDWKNTGIDTIGLYKEDITPCISWKETRKSQWHLKYQNSDGAPDVEIHKCGNGYLPVTGDWDGDGMDSIGCMEARYLLYNDYSKRRNIFYLMNDNAAVHSFARPTFTGIGSRYDMPLAGDWDGDGMDTVGIYDPLTAEFVLAKNNAGATEIYKRFNFGVIGDLPIVGDWDGDGMDTVGVFRPTEGKFFLAKSNDNPNSDIITIIYGKAGDMPIKGKFFASSDLCIHSCGDNQCQSNGKFKPGSTCPETKYNCPQDCRSKCTNPAAFGDQVKCENGIVSTCSNKGSWEVDEKGACNRYTWKNGACKYTNPTDIWLLGESCMLTEKYTSKYPLDY